MDFAKENVLQAIGNTPIVKLSKKLTGVDSEIYVKMEFMNPGGSIKDRIGCYILDEAVKKGELKPGGTIIEGTSGNTGVGLAMWAAVNGYKTIFVLADKQSKEKIENLRAFGAKVIVCPTNVEPDDPQSYYSVSKRLAETIPNSYFVNQYDNLSNRLTHYNTTGPEIWEQTGGNFDVYMATVGTGGTISGIGMYLKEKNPDIKVVGIDIEGSILAHYHKTGEMSEAKPYVLEGVGEDIIPLNINWDTIDDFVVVKDKESFIMTRKLLTTDGIYAGGSSGAAIVGAIRYAKELKEPKKILVILPDSGNRYASKIYNDDWMREFGYTDSTFNVMIKEAIEGLNRTKRDILTIPNTSTIQDAIDMMDKEGISQLPIMDGDTPVGVVTEKELLRPIFEGKLTKKDNVSVASNPNFEVIDIHEMLEKVTNALMHEKTVLITESGKIKDIITNIDILHFVSGK